MKKYKYCPYCGSSLSKKKEFFKCIECGKKIYINSLPTVSGFVVENGRYLLAKRGIKPNKGMLDVVGGFLNNGEDPKKGVAREFMEETGLSIRAEKLLGLYRGKYIYQNETINTLNLCYTIKVLKGKMKAQDDAAELLWFPMSKVPRKLSSPWIKNAIKDLQKLYAKEHKVKTRN